MRYLLFICIFFMHTLVAASMQQQALATISRINQKTGAKMELESVNPTPVAGILEVTTNQEILYFSEDGRYVFAGLLIDTQADPSSWNLSLEAKTTLRKKALDAMAAEDLLIYKASNSKKDHISVFFDTTCPYSRKLHEEVLKLNAAGVEVRYISFPRAGEDSVAYKDAVSIWCSKDKHSAMDKLNAQDKSVEQSCANHPIEKHLQLVKSLGIDSTPFVIDSQGRFMGGYMSAQDILKSLKI